MKIACISASNNKLAEGKSTSIVVCNIIKDIIKETKEEVEVDVIALKDYDIKPCILCGACNKNGLCIYDEEFNGLLKALETVQGIYLVVPHYSPIPSKLLMLFEKINEITYAGWINNSDYQSPFSNMCVGIIGHGGMVGNEVNIKYYHNELITPIANTLRALSFHILQPDDDFPNGVPFGLKDDTCLEKSENSIFPDIIQDWTMIEERIKPFIIKGLSEMEITINHLSIKK
jgi:Multimeric flavodoxin WrbA